MDYSRYENKLKYPVKPTKPAIEKGEGKKESDAHRKYAQQLEVYEEKLFNHKLARDIYNQETSKLEHQFEIDAIEEVGLSHLPEWQKIKVFNYAWQEGHSGGFSEVFNILLDLADLFKED